MGTWILRVMVFAVVICNEQAAEPTLKPWIPRSTSTMVVRRFTGHRKGLGLRVRTKPLTYKQLVPETGLGGGGGGGGGAWGGSDAGLAQLVIISNPLTANVVGFGV